MDQDRVREKLAEKYALLKVFMRQILFGFSKVTVFGGFALGVTIFLTAHIAPALPIAVIEIFFPGQPMEIAGLLRVSDPVMLMLYSVMFIVPSIILHIILKTVKHPHINESRQFREKVLLRFILIFSFSLSFITARTAVALSGIANSPASTGNFFSLPITEVWLYNYHIHHFFYGFAILAIIGWIAVFRENYSKRLVAFLYGVGLGILTDEIGMLLTGGDYFAISTYVTAVLLVSLFVSAFYYDLYTIGSEKGLSNG